MDMNLIWNVADMMGVYHDNIAFWQSAFFHV